MRFIVYIIILVFSLSCKREETRKGTKENLVNISITDIKANSESFNEKRIATSGYFNYTFENVAIYLDFSSGPSNAIWLDFDEELENKLTEDDLNKLQGRKIIVEGKFDSNRRGHLGVFIGTITVSYLETTD